MVDQRIDQRPCPVSCSGMNHKSGLLVDDNEIIILIEDFERNVLADRVGILGVGHIELNLVAGVDLVLGLFGGHTIDGDGTGLDQRLDAAARQIRLELSRHPGIKSAFGVFACHKRLLSSLAFKGDVGFPIGLSFVKRCRVLHYQGPPGKESKCRKSTKTISRKSRLIPRWKKSGVKWYGCWPCRSASCSSVL